MNLNKIVSIIVFFIILNGCADYKINKKEKNYYSSSGFALIYSEGLFVNNTINKKINNNDYVVMHSSLKPNTSVRIINPDNSKTFETKILKKANYPKIFNVVISNKIATFLNLDYKNPYVEIHEIKKNKTFIAKKVSIFQEEKNVAGKAPVDEIKMDDITDEKSVNTSQSSEIGNFILIISEFYYKKSAINLKVDLEKKMNVNNISIDKINSNKYRLSIGPFKNFNALKNTYISLNNLGFEDLNIYKE